MTTIFTADGHKEEVFFAPGIPKSNLPRSQTEPGLNQGNKQNLATKKRRMSTGSDSYPTLDTAPLSNSKRVNDMLTTLTNGTPMSPQQRRSRLGKGLNDVIVHNELETLRILLEQGADPNGTKSSACTPLYVAVDMEMKEACQILLDAGASMIRPSRTKKETPLELALTERTGMAPILLKKLASIEKQYSRQQVDADAPPMKRQRV